jgi:hypothetical protein
LLPFPFKALFKALLKLSLATNKFLDIFSVKDDRGPRPKLSIKTPNPSEVKSSKALESICNSQTELIPDISNLPFLSKSNRILAFSFRLNSGIFF